MYVVVDVRFTRRFQMYSSLAGFKIILTNFILFVSFNPLEVMINIVGSNIHVYYIYISYMLLYYNNN